MRGKTKFAVKVFAMCTFGLGATVTAGTNFQVVTIISSSIGANQHHNQPEVFRVVSGSGALVTSSSMSAASPLDPDDDIVLKLTGPGDRGIIDTPQNSQLIGTGDMVINPAGVAHGLSEITELVVRVDPDNLVVLK